MIPTSSIAPWRLVLPMITVLASPTSAGFAIRDLGVIAPSGTSNALALNALGETTGQLTGLQGGQVAVMSPGSGTFQALTISGASSSVGQSINVHGDVAGYYTDAAGIKHGFAMGTGQSAVYNPFSVGTQVGTSVTLSGINDSGQVAGTLGLVGGSTRAFFTGMANSPSVIAPLDSGTKDVANGINNQGTVVGTSEIAPSGYQHAFVTDALGNAVDLITSKTQGDFRYNSYGTAINNNGDVVGYGDAGSSEHAFFAPGHGGSLVDLGVLYGGTSSMANAVNGLDNVVGKVQYGPSLPGDPNSGAFLWNASDGMVDLNSLLLPSDQANWVLTDATGINDLNQITGQGYFDGVLSGFVLTPIPGGSIFEPAVSVVPEPPAWVLSALGLAMAAARFRRGRTGGRAAA